MKTPIRLVTCFIALAIYSFISPAIAAPEKDVNVVNTPDVVVANTPDVNVVNMPDVNVASLPSVSIDTDIRTPYHTSANITEWTAQSVNAIVEIPAGHRFVIEHISASAFMHPQVELSSVAIYPHAGGTSTTHVFTLTETAPGFTGSNTYAGSHSVRIVTDQSFLARFTKVSVGGSLDLGTASIAVSGYLLPLTSPSLSP